MRGAFTGAVGNRQGRLEQAHKGTLFLDEVGTMSAALQMKLLRVLQEREFERVGDSHTTKVDVRVIAATNSDLRQMVADGQFREDLYLPAERDSRCSCRRCAIARKTSRCSSSISSTSFRIAAQPPVTVSQEAMRRLMAYRWPGNVRQLENAIERAVAFSGGRDADRRRRSAAGDPAGAGAAAAVVASTLPEDGVDLDAFIADIERELIQRSLERTGGNKGQAARLLNLKRTTLVEKLKRFEKDKLPGSHRPTSRI